MSPRSLIAMAGTHLIVLSLIFQLVYWHLNLQLIVQTAQPCSVLNVTPTLSPILYPLPDFITFFPSSLIDPSWAAYKIHLFSCTTALLLICSSSTKPSQMLLFLVFRMVIIDYCLSCSGLATKIVQSLTSSSNSFLVMINLLKQRLSGFTGQSSPGSKGMLSLGFLWKNSSWFMFLENDLAATQPLSTFRIRLVSLMSTPSIFFSSPGSSFRAVFSNAFAPLIAAICSILSIIFLNCSMSLFFM